MVDVGRCEMTPLGSNFSQSGGFQLVQCAIIGKITSGDQSQTRCRVCDHHGAECFAILALADNSDDGAGDD